MIIPVESAVLQRRLTGSVPIMSLSILWQNAPAQVPVVDGTEDLHQGQRIAAGHFQKKWRPRSGAIFHHAELENERGVPPFRKPLNVNLSS